MSAASQSEPRDVADDYRLTLRVLAVVCERLLAVSQGQSIEIGDEAIRDSPDLIAARDEPRKRIVLTVER